MRTRTLGDSAAVRYGLAVFASILVLLTRLALDPLLNDQAPLLLFILSITVASAWGGLGPGLVATLLGATLGVYFLLPPRQVFAISQTGDMVRTSLFLLEGAFIAGLLESRRRETEKALRDLEDLVENRARLGAVVESAMDAIVVTDREQHIVAFNPAAERMFGYTADEVKGQSLSLLLPERYRKAHEEHVERFGRSGIAGRHMGALGVLSALNRDGREFPIEATISQVRPGGQILYTAIVRDVSERERTAAFLNEATHQQKRFVREMLFSVTEGRLRLCENADDLPETLPAAGDPIELVRPTLSLLRKQVEAVAEGLRLVKERRYDLETAVGEAAMNAVVHAGGGEGRVHADRERAVVQVWIRDNGTGISQESLHKATIERGWTTAGTLGHGFWMMLKTCDRVYLLTGPQGTTIVLEQERNEPMPAWMQGM